MIGGDSNDHSNNRFCGHATSNTFVSKEHINLITVTQIFFRIIITDCKLYIWYYNSIWWHLVNMVLTSQIE